MKTETQPGLLDRHLSPRVLLVGLVISFLACCLIGRLVSRRPLYKDFVRFHNNLSPESMYYPTASQVEKLVESDASADQVVVLVGSSSILFGSGQQEREVWTKKLQSRLGDRYKVINLAMPDCGTMDFGGIAAEMSAAKHPKLIFVTSAQVNGTKSRPGVCHPYRYLFWDALYKRLLPTDAEHKEWAARVKHGQVEDEATAELRRQMRVDGVVYDRDLWTAVTYQTCSTVWCPQGRFSFPKARRKSKDNEGGFDRPLATRYPPANENYSMEVIRILLATGELALHEPHPPLAATLEYSLPPSSRARTLVLFPQSSPHYVERLTPDERSRYRAMFVRAVEVVERTGISSMSFGANWESEDYYDFCHPSETGGAKLAAEVAPKVEEMARRLQYLP